MRRKSKFEMLVVEQVRSMNGCMHRTELLVCNVRKLDAWVDPQEGMV
jgi:hypothetical protein